MSLKIILVLSILSAAVLGAKFPANQQKCLNGDSACMIKVANEILSKAKQGYFELGLPIFDPLKIEKMKIEQGGDGPVNLNINLRNFELKGLSGVKVTQINGFRKDFERAKMEIRFNYPILSIYGPYKLEGKVLVLPVQGDGIANLTFYDNDVTMKILTKKIVRHGKSYMQVDKAKLNFETPKVSVYFTNLFNGNKELGETTNLFFNENWKDIEKEIKPALSESIASIYQTLINNVFSSIPYEEMFLA